MIPFLTIAICTFNRADFLKICLAYLVPQVVNFKEDACILIVNNNSTDNTYQIVKKFSESTGLIKYINCENQGLSYARNAAVEACKTEWISFLDDDAYPEENWLQENIKLIKSKKFQAFGGVYYPWFKDGKRLWFKDIYESNARWMPKEVEKRLTPKDSYFSGGNCTFLLNSIVTEGGFNPVLGMKGNKQSYGEETSLQRKIAKRGGKLGFSHKMIIYHYTPLKKQSIYWSMKRHFAEGLCFWETFEKKPTFKNLLNQVVIRLESTFKSILLEMKMSISNDDFSMRRVLYEASRVSGVLSVNLSWLKKRIKAG